MRTGFGNSEPRTFFKIKDGKIVVKDLMSGKDSFYDHYIGSLRSIVYSEKEVEFNGRKQLIKSYNVTFVDDAGQLYIWSPMPKTLLFQGFINCLCSIDKFDGIILKLQPYMKDGKQRLSIMYADKHTPNDWVRLGWQYKYSDLPEIKTVMGKNGKPLTDTSGNLIYDFDDRLRWIADQVKLINDRLISAGVSDDVEYVEKVEFDIEDSLNDVPF